MAEPAVLAIAVATCLPNLFPKISMWRLPIVQDAKRRNTEQVDVAGQRHFHNQVCAKLKARSACTWPKALKGLKLVVGDFPDPGILPPSSDLVGSPSIILKTDNDQRLM